MLNKLIGFEIKLHTRQVGFWVTVVIMFLFGLVVMSTDVISISSNTGERVKANGAITLALQASVLSLGSIFFGAIFVVNGIMRDQTHKALEMIHATPISTYNMTLSRMIGVYVATFICILAAVIGLFYGQFMPWIDEESLGPINILYFLQPSIVYIAVNTLLISGLFTAIAAITRNRALVYVSAVGLFILYIMSGLFVGQDAPDWAISMVDPFGANALAVTTEFWPADEQNTRMSPLSGYIGLNRLVWGGLGMLLFVGIFRLFKRGLITRKTKLGADVEHSETGRIIVKPAPPTFSIGNTFSAFLTRFKYEYLTTVKSIPFAILTLLALSIFATAVYVQTVFVPDPVLPTNLQMAQTVLGSTMLPLLIILVFFSGEIIWRDKTAGITEILDASPVKNWPLMAGKWTALMAVILTILLLAAVFGMAAQLMLGDVPINIFIYLKYSFGVFAPRLLLFAALVLFIQNFMPNRVVGMIAAGVFTIFFFFFVSALPFYHPLMGYGSVPTGGVSELNGFADPIRYKWFAIYWGSLAALFGVLSIWLWRRGLQSSLFARLRGLGKCMSLPTMAGGAVFLASFLGSGAYIYKSYNIDNDFRTRKQQEKRQVRAEKLLAEAFALALPKIRSLDAEVDFRPAQQTALFKGRYTIENTTGAPLEEIYISVASGHEEDNRKLTLKGATRVSEGENLKEIEDFGYQIYRFTPPLAAGAITDMDFETYFHAPRLGDGSRIRKNGTFVNNTQVMPILGVQDRRMRNPDRRRKYGLPKLEKRPERTDMAARNKNFVSPSADYIDFKAKVCTDIGQIPIAPGKLMRAYEQDGQACRDYELMSPTFNYVAFLSADYTVRKDVWKNPQGDNIDLEIYYHKPHDYNVELMMGAMKKSMDTYTKVFSPYQYGQIRIMEFPYASFAQGYAGTIPFSENIGFVRDPGDPEDIESVDLASYVTMHEIGHQWFGHQIMPADTKGFNVLSEGLTENAAMTAYEQALGWQKARRLLEQRAIQSYLQGRTLDRDDEPPLAQAGNQQYLVYNKASWVFWGLKQYIGEDAMQGAIRGLIAEYGLKGPPYPTTKELIEALRSAASEDYQGLITDYWERITFWDLKFGEDIDIKPNVSGGFTIDLTAIVDKRIASEETGKETSVTEIEGEELNEWIEIGFYKQDPKETLGGDWLQLERVRVNSAETALTFNLAERPTFVALDPRRLLIERNVKDNAQELK
jgi:ABC-2 type transport system permease protein